MITSENTRQSQDIHFLKTEVANKVHFPIFIWAMGLILIVIGIVVSYSMNANNKAQTAIDRVSESEGDIKAINNSLGNIGSSIIRMENKIDNLKQK